MTAIRAIQPVATLDDFLADPLVLAEFQEVIERLMSARSTPAPGGYLTVSDMRVKVCEDGEQKRGTSEPKRTAWTAEDVAPLIFATWRAMRP